MEIDNPWLDNDKKDFDNLIFFLFFQQIKFINLNKLLPWNMYKTCIFRLIHCITHIKKIPENQENRQNFDPSILPYKFGLIFMRMKKKNWRKKFKMADFSKWPFFKIANSRFFFAKISEIGPWVSWVDWCEGHWCGSICMVVRRSEISSQTA